MGGGFGQSRGDVAEFDALSQVHVLELLASVREWDWTAKAGTLPFSDDQHIHDAISLPSIILLEQPDPLTRTSTTFFN